MALWPGVGEEIGQRLAALDRSGTPLGPVAQWPARLHTVAEMVLASRQPAYVAWGPELRLLYNEACIPLLGARHPAAFGQPLGAAWPALREAQRAALDATLAGEAQAAVPHPVRLPGGMSAPLRFAWTPLRDEAGAIRGFHASAVESRAALPAHERLRAAFDIQTVGVMFWSQDFGLTDMNEAFLRMSGYTREQALGRTWQEFTPPEFHPASWNAVQEVLTRGETTPYEKQYLRKDGSRWWGLFAARRVGDEVVEFVLDVSERRDAEAALRAADRRKDEFLATLAHELRNPLAPLRNGLQIARLMHRSDETLRRTVDMMDRQLSHLVRLVDDLLDVGRISTGKLELRRRPIAVGQVLAASVEATRAAIESYGHELVIESGPEELVVLGDFDRLSQVFTNLLSNAVKYTESGGRIRIGVARDDDTAVVRVTDSGIGIPHAEAPRVFDLFSQVRSHQGRHSGGLGIGLALVKRLVELHGGQVDAQSAGPGRGSTFTVRLPTLAHEALARGGPARAASRAGAPPRRVLIADDNADAAASLAAVLGMLGHSVWTANDGEDALQKAERVRPDIVFLDLGMPRMNGIEAARRIRSLPFGRDTLLVALTGWGQETDRLRTAQAGFDRHLVKPVDPEQLDAILWADARPAANG